MDRRQYLVGCVAALAGCNARSVVDDQPATTTQPIYRTCPGPAGPCQYMRGIAVIGGLEHDNGDTMGRRRFATLLTSREAANRIVLRGRDDRRLVEQTDFTSQLLIIIQHAYHASSQAFILHRVIQPTPNALTATVQLPAMQGGTGDLVVLNLLARVPYDGPTPSSLTVEVEKPYRQPDRPDDEYVVTETFTMAETDTAFPPDLRYREPPRHVGLAPTAVLEDYETVRRHNARLDQHGSRLMYLDVRCVGTITREPREGGRYVVIKCDEELHFNDGTHRTHRADVTYFSDTEWLERYAGRLPYVASSSEATHRFSRDLLVANEADSEVSLSVSLEYRNPRVFGLTATHDQVLTHEYVLSAGERHPLYDVVRGNGTYQIRVTTNGRMTDYAWRLPTDGDASIRVRDGAPRIDADPAVGVLYADPSLAHTPDDPVIAVSKQRLPHEDLPTEVVDVVDHALREGRVVPSSPINNDRFRGILDRLDQFPDAESRERRVGEPPGWYIERDGTTVLVIPDIE